MSEISESIDAVIAQGLSMQLKSAGFKKTGRTWHKQTPTGWQVVNVQASSGNIGSVGKFAINLGIYCTAIAEMAEAAVEGRPKEYQTTLRERLGVLAKGQDYWWQISELVDLAKVSAEVVTLMESHGLPWLDHHSSVPAISEVLKVQPSLQSVASAYLSGGKEASLTRLRWALAERPAAKTRLIVWARKHGLDP